MHERQARSEITSLCLPSYQVHQQGHGRHQAVGHVEDAAHLVVVELHAAIRPHHHQPLAHGMQGGFQCLCALFEQVSGDAERIVCMLAFGDVDGRARHHPRATVRVAGIDAPPLQQPHPMTRLVPEAELAFVVFRQAVNVLLVGLFQAVFIGRVQQQGVQRCHLTGQFVDRIAHQ